MYAFNQLSPSSKKINKQNKYENCKRKNLIGKSKYTVKVIDQPLIKLEGSLKDKSKIIYIHNKQLRNTQTRKV